MRSAKHSPMFHLLYLRPVDLSPPKFYSPICTHTHFSAASLWTSTSSSASIEIILLRLNATQQQYGESVVVVVEKLARVEIVRRRVEMYRGSILYWARKCRRRQGAKYWTVRWRCGASVQKSNNNDVYLRCHSMYDGPSNTRRNIGYAFGRYFRGCRWLWRSKPRTNIALQARFREEWREWDDYERVYLAVRLCVKYYSAILM